ncbi:MAG: hypothetical protein ACRES6_09885 [Steroidobacteraceae bacterium]
MSKTDMVALLKATGVAWGLATVIEADYSESAVAQIGAAAQVFRAYADLHGDKALLEEAAWLESLASRGPGPIKLHEAGRQRGARLAKRFRPDWDHLIGPLPIFRR